MKKELTETKHKTKRAIKKSSEIQKVTETKTFSNNLIVLLTLLALVIVVLFSLLTVQFKLFSKPEISKLNTNLLNKAYIQPLPETAKLPLIASQEGKKNAPEQVISQQTSNQLYLPILMYHYVGNNPIQADHMRDVLSISPDKFDEQMKYLSENGYTTLSLDTFYASLIKQTKLPNKSVVLTFDDGYIDFYYNAYNILKKYNLNATVFVITGFVGKSAYLNWEQIKEMQASGIIHFGAHTVHHYQLTTLSDEGVRSELSESKRVLQQELGIPINFMAYPYGITNDRVIKITQETGFIGSAGTWSNKFQSSGTIFNMPRLRVNGAINLPTFVSFL